MSVDIEIYMSNIQKFFKDNPKDLMNLVPKEKEEEFYVMIREVAEQNFEKNGEKLQDSQDFFNLVEGCFLSYSLDIQRF